jgi:hypothetical protein
VGGYRTYFDTTVARPGESRRGRAIRDKTRAGPPDPLIHPAPRSLKPDGDSLFVIASNTAGSLTNERAERHAGRGRAEQSPSERAQRGLPLDG